MPDNHTDTKRMLIIAVFTFLIGLGIGWSVFNGGDQEIGGASDVSEEMKEEKEMDQIALSPPSPDSTDTSSVLIRPDVTSISVADQPAGDNVILKSLSIKDDSWIAIHEDFNGKPGNILGAARYRTGVHQNVSVHLLRNTVAGGIYYAMIHIDDGDDQFDFTKDTPRADVNEKIMMTEFSTFSQ